MSHALKSSALLLSLNHRDSELALIRIAGVPVIVRTIMALSNLGVAHLAILIHADQQLHLKNFLKRYQRKRLPEVTFVNSKANLQGDDAEEVLEIPINHFLNQRDLHGGMLIESPQDARSAERLLLEEIRRSTPGPIARHLNKRISLPVSLLLARAWIHPHFLTGVNFSLGILSCVLIADGHRYGVMLMGGTLFQIVSILDGCDGEVARLTFRCSKFGEYLDTICDYIVFFGAIVAMVIGSWKATESPSPFIAVGIFLLADVVIFTHVIRSIKRYTESGYLVTYERVHLPRLLEQAPSWMRPLISRGRLLLKKEFFSLLIFLLAVTGCVYSFLFLAAGVTACTALLLLFLDSAQKRLTEPMWRER